MPSKVISFYDGFSCLAGDCPASCCMGWRIPVDDATAALYRGLPAKEKRPILSHIKKGREFYEIKKLLGRCPFLDSDRLCVFQSADTPERMPKVCRLYPRNSVGFGEFNEITMELSCPAAARLLLSSEKRLSFVPTGYEIEALWEIDNEDAQFLSFLIEDREKILDFLWDDKAELTEKWQAIYAYSRHENDLIMRNRMDGLDTLALSYDAIKQGEYYIDREPTYAFYSLKTIDRMILEHLDYGAMPIRSPKFYTLIKKYLKVFSNLTVKDADKLLTDTVRDMEKADPSCAAKYRAYFSYCIQELYLLAYENYFVLRQILFAILYTELFMIFEVSEYISTKRMPDINRHCEILYLLEHHVRHNPALSDNLLNVLREEFL